MYMANAKVLHWGPNATCIPLTRLGFCFGGNANFMFCVGGNFSILDTNMLVYLTQNFALGVEASAMTQCKCFCVTVNVNIPPFFCNPKAVPDVHTATVTQFHCSGSSSGFQSKSIPSILPIPSRMHDCAPPLTNHKPSSIQAPSRKPT